MFAAAGISTVSRFSVKSSCGKILAAVSSSFLATVSRSIANLLDLLTNPA